VQFVALTAMFCFGTSLTLLSRDIADSHDALRELEYVLDNGAKVALIKPGPVNDP